MCCVVDVEMCCVVDVELCCVVEICYVEVSNSSEESGEWMYLHCCCMDLVCSGECWF